MDKHLLGLNISNCPTTKDSNPPQVVIITIHLLTLILTVAMDLPSFTYPSIMQMGWQAHPHHL